MKEIYDSILFFIVILIIYEYISGVNFNIIKICIVLSLRPHVVPMTKSQVQTNPICQ